MKYINKKTQAVIETACILNGGDWEQVEDKQPKASAKTKSKKTANKKSGGNDE